MTTRRVRCIFAAVILVLAGCATTRDGGLDNRAEADSFFTQNRLMECIHETRSGLQYKVIKPGDGSSPSPRDAVFVKYRGYFIGQQTPFDVAKNEALPTRVPLSGVIEGWREGILLMKEGASYVFYIPPRLAYGEKGAPPQVGPNKALIYEIELVRIDAPH